MLFVVVPLCIPKVTKKHSHMKKITISRIIPEQPFHHKSTTYYLTYKEKFSSITNLISSHLLLSSPSLSQVRISTFIIGTS